MFLLLAPEHDPTAAPARPGLRYGLLLAAWLVVRTVLWLVVVLVSQPNPSLDLVEWLSWGHTFQWGYPKHPPLPAWLAAGFARLSPGDVWGVYLLGYLTAAGCLVAAWRLAREYLPPREALLAAVCLDGLTFLTNDPAEWSNNVALDLGWAWIVVFAHRAIRTRSTGWWGAIGLAIGLTLLCKYTVGVLLLPLAVYLVATPEGRANLRRPGPYLAAVVALAVFAPHLAWLAEHDFITLTYAAERSARGGWIGHLTHPVLFLLAQAWRLAPVAMVLWPVLGRRSAGDRLLHAAVLGPVAVLLAVSLATGSQLRDIWGSPLWTLLGVWSLVTFRVGRTPADASRGLRRAVVVGLAMMAFVLLKQGVGPYLTPKPDRPHFPGKPLADEVNRRWAEQFGCPVPIVAGEPWAAGNVCVFSPQRPVLYSNGAVGSCEFDARVTPWTSDDDLNARGGVILWDALHDGNDLPAALKARLPRAVTQPPIESRYQTGAPIPPARIGVAFVPPWGKSEIRSTKSETEPRTEEGGK